MSDARDAAELQAEVDAAWSAIWNSFDIEPRSYFEEKSKTNGFKYALPMAVHYMWKRDAKVAELEAELAVYRRELDPTPVDEAWLRSVGIPNAWIIDGQSKSCLYDEPQQKLVECYFENGKHLRSSVYVSDVSVAKVKGELSRGTFRTLCRAMGVELKENT